MPVYFIQSEHILGQRVRLDSDLEHHLGNVLRLKIGETIRLIDETPKRYVARVLTTRPHPVTLEIESESLRPSGDSPKIRLCVALIKREKMDWIVQKATELGVTRISPVLTEHTVIRPDFKRAARQVARWEKIAKEAAQQSCRWDMPRIDPPVDLQTVFSEPENQGFQFIFSEQCSPSEGKQVIEKALSVSGRSGTLMIGPEGGWSASELAQAEASDYISLSLGERILRTETAVLAALSILQYELSYGTP